MSIVPLDDLIDRLNAALFDELVEVEIPEEPESEYEPEAEDAEEIERAAMERQLDDAQRGLHRRIFGGAIPYE